MKEIMNRRSVRSYRSETIPDNEIEALLRAAMRAPSAGNEQPWEFVVLRDRETLRAITEFHEYSGMLTSADCAVVVCGNRERQKYAAEHWVQDCSAATQNLLIEAVHLGIGAVWLGVYPLERRVKGLQKLLHLPEQVVPLCIVSLGYPAAETPPLDTFLPERIHREAWGQK